MDKNGVKVCDFCEEPLSMDSDETCQVEARTHYFNVHMIDDTKKVETGLICNDCLAGWLIEIPHEIELLSITKEGK